MRDELDRRLGALPLSVLCDARQRHQILLIVGAVLTGALTFLLFRGHSSRMLRTLIYALVAFFTIVYPLSSLLDQVSLRNALDGIVQVGLIVYLFGLTLYTRLGEKRV